MPANERRPTRLTELSGDSMLRIGKPRLAIGAQSGERIEITGACCRQQGLRVAPGTVKVDSTSHNDHLSSPAVRSTGQKRS
jgi:hypothetical protein